MLKKFFSVVLATVLVVLPFTVTAQVSAQELPPLATAYSSVSVRVDNVSCHNLYAFITNIQNDHLWYPGILETTLIHTGPNGALVGTQYQQVASVGGVLTTTTVIDVLAAYTDLYYVLHGDGDIADYYALYTFVPTSGGGCTYTLNSQYTAPGLTEEFFSQYITFALGGLLTYYNSPGAVTINFLYVVPAQ